MPPIQFDDVAGRDTSGAKELAHPEGGGGWGGSSIHLGQATLSMFQSHLAVSPME